MLAFYTDIFFQMLTIIQEDKYNYLHVHRWESWSIERLADSVRSLSQHFNLYLSDSTCSTCQCSTVSISIFAFRARSDDILGYYQIFFSEVCTQSLASCNILSVQGQSSFYVSALVAIYFAQSHHERGSWGRKYVALSPDWTGMIQNSGVVCIIWACIWAWPHGLIQCKKKASSSWSSQAHWHSSPGPGAKGPARKTFT